VNPKLLEVTRNMLASNNPIGTSPENLKDDNLSKKLFSVLTKIAARAPAESSQALLMVRK
jgi:hypothetical protein